MQMDSVTSVLFIGQSNHEAPPQNHRESTWEPLCVGEEHKELVASFHPLQLLPIHREPLRDG
jgi:hypothetical protein